jgi:hypothetical protein
VSIKDIGPLRAADEGLNHHLIPTATLRSGHPLDTQWVSRSEDRSERGKCADRRRNLARREGLEPPTLRFEA